MSLTLQNMNTLLIDYEKAIVKNLSETDVISLFQTRQTSGSHVEFPVHVQRNSALGGGSDGSAYRDAGHQSHLKAEIYMAFFDNAIALSDGARAAGRGANAVREALAQEVNGIADDTAHFMSSVAFGDGTGDCGELAANVSTNTAIFELISGSICLPQLLTWTGAKFDVYTDSSGAPGTFVETVTIDYVNATASSGRISVELASGHGLNGAGAGYHFVWKGTTESSLNKLMKGLNYLVANDGGTFQNIDTDRWTKYSSYVDSNSGTLRDPDVDMFKRAQAAAFARTNMNPGDAVCLINPHTYAQLDAIVSDSTYQRYFVGETKVGNAVEKVLTNHGGLTFMQTGACPDNQVFCPDKTQLVRYVQEELGFVDRGTGALFESLTAKQAVGHMRMIAQNAIMDRRTSWRIDDLDSSEYRKTSFA